MIVKPVPKKSSEDTFYEEQMIGGQLLRVNVELKITLINLENG